MEIDINAPVTKELILQYINYKPYLRVENYGRHYRCRIGERSYMEGIFSSQSNAEKALKLHAGKILKLEQKRIAKRKEDAKKSKS